MDRTWDAAWRLRSRGGDEAGEAEEQVRVVGALGALVGFSGEDVHEILGGPAPHRLRGGSRA